MLIKATVEDIRKYGEFADGKMREDVLRELLAASLNACRRMGAKYMTYLSGGEEKQVLADLGFQRVGQYLLYMKCLR